MVQIYMKSLPRVNNYDILTQTAHGSIQYSCKTKFLQLNELIKYSNKKAFDMLCKQGCPNYGKKWSCPPYAPAFEHFVKPFIFIQVIMLLVEMGEFSYIKNDYLKINAANSVLKSRIDKALRLCMDNNEFYISTGSCRLCKPCKKKFNEKCSHPEKRTYSFEALGINVSAMIQDLFQTKLLWYKSKTLPEYTCVVAGLLTNCEEINDKVVKQLMQFD